MDATRRPLKIPPEFSVYADKHAIFDLYKRILSELIVARPDDPLTFISEYLEREDDDVPQIMVFGAPGSGKQTISRMICRSLGTVLVTPGLLCADPEIRRELEKLNITSEEERNKVDAADWARLVKTRLSRPDALKNGWVLVDLPETRNHQKSFTDLGIFPKHCIILEAADSVLIERAEGKRVDPLTGDSYHITYDWPTNEEIASRLVRHSLLDVEGILKRIVEHKRSMDLVLPQYKHLSLTVNSDQPKSDVYADVMAYLCQPGSTCAPRTPRIVLVGPSGSGRHTSLLLEVIKGHNIIERYGIVTVDVEHMVKEAIAAETELGLLFKAQLDAGQPVSDSALMELIKKRLSRHDCVTRGWLLIGFPLNRDQAKLLNDDGFVPNRVLVLEVSTETVLERLSLRRTDPVTGHQHHLINDPPRNQATKSRLLTHPQDQEQQVLIRVEAQRSRIQEVVEFYGRVVQHINADQDKQNVAEAVESAIVKPMPKCFV